MTDSLRPEHRRELEASGISPDLIDAAGLRSISESESFDFGFRSSGGATAGLFFPFTDPTTWRQSTRFALLKPTVSANGSRYLSPVGERLRLYIVPGLSESTLKDASIPVWIIGPGGERARWMALT